MQHFLDAAKGQLNDFVANFRVLADKFDGWSGLGISQVKIMQHYCVSARVGNSC